MTEIMPVPRNLSFTVLPAESLRGASFVTFQEVAYFLNITLDFLNNRCIICAYDEYGGT